MLIHEEAPIEVHVYRSLRDGALVVQIDTIPETGRVRIDVNDNTVFDQDPEEGS